MISGEKDRMRYLLLRTQAMNKAFIMLDTIKYMDEVVCYYERHGTNADRVQAYYMQGSVCRDKHDGPRALEYFQKALSCIDTTDGSYNFASTNNPDYYPLAAYVTESQNQQVNAKITVDNTEYDSILYAPKGKTDTISITTTLAKSLMDKDSALSLNNAETQAEEIVKKAESLATVLTVYNNALNTSSETITNIPTSIRGLVNVITDKLNKETNITDNTNITVSQEEVNTANDEITKADEEQPQEPQEPENPSGEPATPLEKVTEMLAGAEIKNAENRVNLNEHVDPL